MTAIHHATVLLVDPHDAPRQAHASLLRESGYEVLEVRNGVEGLRLARERLPDLIVVDLWPFFSASLQMLERLPGTGVTRSTRVLVVTTPVAPGYRARALAAGCADYLEKPCAPEEVLYRVQRLLGSAPPGRVGAGQEEHPRILLAE